MFAAATGSPIPIGRLTRGMKVLITGGCGFIGTNLALERLEKGDQVRVLDNCSRAGTERNKAHLESLNDANLDLVDGDIRDADTAVKAAADADVIFHLAAQVAVTASVTDPRTDFDINALGTLNVLEGARLPAASRSSSTPRRTRSTAGSRTSRSRSRRRATSSPPSRTACPRHGRSTSTRRTAARRARPTSTSLDYARIYGLPTVVFRQSCIYGPWQFGNEDQGWIAHFLIRALDGEGLTLYGDGKQVRDCSTSTTCSSSTTPRSAAPEKVAGRAYNIGGGPGLHDLAARVRRPHAERRAPRRRGLPRRVAPRRPARLHQRHPAGRGRSRLDATHELRRGHGPPARRGSRLRSSRCASSSRTRPASRRPTTMSSPPRSRAPAPRSSSSPRASASRSRPTRPTATPGARSSIRSPRASSGARSCGSL